MNVPHSNGANDLRRSELDSGKRAASSNFSSNFSQFSRTDFQGFEMQARHGTTAWVNECFR